MSMSTPAVLEQLVTPVVTDGEGLRLRRTMRGTDRLQALMDYYHAIAPGGGGEGVFVHNRRRISGKSTPADYGMKDGDEIRFFPEVELVTPVLRDLAGRSFARTMRSTDGMQGLFDFYTAMVPAAAVARDDGIGGDGGVFLYRGEHVTGEHTPAGLGMMKDRDRVYFVPAQRGEVAGEKQLAVDGVHVTVKVRDFEGRTVHRTMRRSDKLKALMDLYYDTVHAADGDGAFVFDGRLLRGGETPAELEMEDGHEVLSLVYGSMPQESN
ncbi:hypothetical protein ZWY2020_037524 [Hordeum vulgare]|nr:hypothetical protein ZWY2020_037524 [Hordeum vulgare]